MENKDILKSVWIWKPSKESISKEQSFDENYISLKENHLGKFNADYYSGPIGEKNFIKEYQTKYDGTDRMSALAKCFWSFGNEVNVGDIVLACEKVHGVEAYRVYAWGTVSEGYDWFDEEYAHSISVDWNKIKETDIGIKYKDKPFFKRLKIDEVIQVQELIHFKF